MTIPRPIIPIPCPACHGTHVALERLAGRPVVVCPSIRGTALRYYGPAAALVVGEDEKKGKT